MKKHSNCSNEGFAGLFITHSIGKAFHVNQSTCHVSTTGRMVAEFDIPFEYPESRTLDLVQTSQSYVERSQSN